MQEVKLHSLPEALYYLHYIALHYITLEMLFVCFLLLFCSHILMLLCILHEPINVGFKFSFFFQ